MRACCEKGGCCGRQTCIIEVEKATSLWRYIFWMVLWQPLITKTNDHTSGKSLKLDIKWEVYKRT